MPKIVTAHRAFVVVRSLRSLRNSVTGVDNAALLGDTSRPGLPRRESLNECLSLILPRALKELSIPRTHRMTHVAAMVISGASEGSTPNSRSLLRRRTPVGSARGFGLVYPTCGRLVQG